MTWLLSWLWQTIMLVAIVEVLLRWQRKLQASARHAVWLVILGAVMAWPVAARVGAHSSNGLLELRAHREAGVHAGVPRLVPPPNPGAGHPADAIGTAGAATVRPLIEIGLPAQPGWLPFVIACLWLSVAIVHLAFLLRGFAAVARLRRAARPMPESAAGRLAGWSAERLHGRAVSLCISNACCTPVALGLGRPSILIPAHLLDELQPEELDQVVLHELAHLRRRDDWTRLAQALAQALTALHPAVWWIGRRLDVEREAACDAFVTGRTGRPRAYALCLTKVAALSERPYLVPGLASEATRSGRELTERVVRLLDPSARWSSSASAVAALLIVAAASTTTGAAATFVAVVSPAATTWIAEQAAPVSTPSVPGARATRLSNLPLGYIPPAAIATERKELAPVARVEPASPGRRLERQVHPVAVDVPGKTLASDPQGLVGRPGSRLAQPGATGIVRRTAVIEAAAVLEAMPIEPTLRLVSPGLATPEIDALTASSGRNRWLVFAEAGTAIGAGAKDAGLATAGFFGNVGRVVAGAF